MTTQMRTRFDPANQARSDRAHALAQRVFYPSFFGSERLTYEQCSVGGAGERSKILDGEMAVDRIISVAVHHLKAPVTQTIQERFRQPEFARYRDITLTEWNYASGLPSELFKITAGWFVYGYHNTDFTAFLDIVAVPVAPMLHALCTGELRFGRPSRNNKQQSFISLSFDDLEALGLLKRAPNISQLPAADLEWPPNLLRNSGAWPDLYESDAADDFMRG